MLELAKILALLLVVAALLAGLVVAIWYVIERNQRITQGLEAIKKQLEAEKEERLYAKCSGLFGRLLRQLDKLDDFPFAHKRVSATVMEITHKEITMRVAIRPELAGYELGQFIAYDLPMGAGHGCENALESFARGIKGMFDRMGRWEIEMYHRRNKERAEYEASRNAEALKPQPPKSWRRDIFRIIGV